MYYKKIMAVMLAGCLLYSGCGKNESEELETVERVVSTEVPSEESTEGTIESESTEEESASETETEDSSKEGTEEASTAESKEKETKNVKETKSADETKKSNEKGAYLEELFQFHVTIGKTEYTLPEEFQKFEEMEWNCDGSKDITLNPSEYIADEAIYKNKYLLYVSFANFGYDILPISECSVTSITFDQIAFKDVNPTIVLAGDIAYGKASYQDIIQAYGDPTTEEKTDNETVLTYGEEDFCKVVLTVNKQKDRLTEITLVNFNQEEAEPEISTGTLDIVKNYKAPKELGNDIQASIIKYDGVLYQLPAPISVFLENGWECAEDAYDAVAGRGRADMYLEKGNYRVKVEITNYTDEIQYLENCFVTWVESENTKEELDVKLVLPGDITTGMKEEDMVKALGKVTYKKDADSSKEKIFYDLTYGSGKMRLTVSKETKELARIALYNRPTEIK